ncbi:class I SAM-dependent DNA methyltransferase [Aquamicrobium defluvii]|uniref:site-specific DNA-methyltransferase (adenine-specific) n=1 Tax=Aquamicrobium defluvii TaxID=69279 RepID=A0A4R6YKA6_9HYPH|nr:class I SAM-dependent DNA methyltransferase [Aquamicrobium defluvii]TDR37564.1 type II restriction/modification system DNA methylase subunit YeeA [Aquamicrobium defluvii]
MTPQQFISKWLNSALKERAAAQEHFLDLCRMLGEPTPADVDPTGKDYGFEVGASKTTGGNGFADVFKRGHFAWEYKGTKANLDTAFAQLQRYAIALDNPPLLIVSDIGTTIRIHTNWTNSVSKVYEIAIADLGDPTKRGWLKAALSDPEALRPTKTRQELTEEVAGEFAELARSLRGRGHHPEQVAHFINRLVFCMFAEDVKLLPENIFSRMLERALDDPSQFEGFARSLFTAMKSGGHIGFEKVAWFNGGLFNDDLVFALDKKEIAIVHRAAKHFWGDVDPSILGTLFERGLDPDKRSQLGAHYTDRDKIMMIINPVIVEPLTAEWEKAKAEITALMDKAASSKGGTATKARNQAQGILDAHLKRLADFRVLDPACGSGNFLYLALRALKDLEHRAQVEAEALGLPRGFPRIGPEVVKGIEINPYAAELARVSVWIGEIQWMIGNGFGASTNPILKPLETIECRDALMTWEPGENGEGGRWVEAVWPKADAIIGNPPFLGGKLMRSQLGDVTIETLFTLYRDRVPPEADLVIYWVEKASTAMRNGLARRAGLVTTNSIRGGANRRVMDRITDSMAIIAAWSDEPWTVEGAAVRVSMVVFGELQDGEVPHLNGQPVEKVNPDLTASAVDLTKASRLSRNCGVAFQGPVKVGAFDIDGQQIRRWLTSGLNPNGRPNSDVLRPWANGMDITRRPAGKWIIDFGELNEHEAALYEGPFEYVRLNIYPVRANNRDEQRRRNWWRLGRSGADVKEATSKVSRVIITPRVSKWRLFIWEQPMLLPDSAVVAIARDDDTTFGILHSRFHELWALRMGTWLGVGNDPRYTPTTTFETFPFPEGLTPDIPAEAYAQDPRAIAIATAAARLNELRENWLNPPDLVRREPEVVPGFPDRILPINEEAAQKLKKRTLTNLYNERPAWLQNAHKTLDEAVAAAYGWPADLSDDEILARLFELNQERAAKQP